MKIGKAYKILGLSRFATYKQVKEKYKELAKIYHPDMTTDPTNRDKFYQIKDAYETICNVKRKQKEIVSEIKSKFAGEEEKGQTASRGGDIIMSLNVTFKEAALGCNKNIPIKRLQNCTCNAEDRDNCPFCHGSGKVLKNSYANITIPRGVFDMQSIIVRGKGHVGDKGRENGDLIVNIHILPDNYYTRDKLNVFTNAYVKFTDACFGCKQTLETLYGDILLNIPPGVDYPYTVCLNGKGIIREDTGEVGNHYIKCLIIVPQNLNNEQKELLGKLSKVL